MIINIRLISFSSETDSLVSSSKKWMLGDTNQWKSFHISKLTANHFMYHQVGNT